MLSEKLVELRSRKGLTQYDVANLLNIPRSTYAQYELGRRQPDYETLRKIAGLFNCSFDYLLGRPTTVEEEASVYTVNQDDLFKVPILGVIRCGAPIPAEESIEGYMYVDKSIARVNKDEKLFYLRVTGDSMAPKFQPGDLVLIRQQPIVDDGDIAVVLIDKQDATLKKVFRSNGTIWLHSLNPAYEPLKFNAEDVHIIGKALLRVGTV